MLKTEGKREVLKSSGFALGFQHLPRDLAKVNEWKIIFDPYIINVWRTTYISTITINTFYSGGERFDHGCSIHTPNSFEEKSRCSPIRETIDPHPQYLNTPLRAKRKLDMDEDPYLISVKRTKTGDYKGLFHFSHVMRKPVYAICEQQRRRSACASAQSDQHICCSLPRKYNTSSFYIRNIKPLDSLCSCAGQFESYLVENLEYRFSRDVAHLISETLRNVYDPGMPLFLTALESGQQV